MTERIRLIGRDLYSRSGVLDDVAFDRSAPDLHRLTGTDLLFDLSDVRWIDHSVLLLLGATLADLRQRGVRARLQLPGSPSITDYLIAWRFPEFCEAVTGSEPCLTEDSHRRVQERRDALDRRYRAFVRGPDGEQIPASIMDSLEISAIELTGDEFADAYGGARRYAERYFQSVLVRKMGRPAGSRFHDSVWECIRNAASHSTARFAYTSTQFSLRRAERPEDRDSPDAPSHELQFAIWDDGVPFWKTLNDAAGGSTGITSELYGAEDVEFDVRVERVPGGFDERLVLTDQRDLLEEQGVRHQRHLLTCAAFMLGVSSDPSRTRRGEGATGDPLEGGVGLAIVRRMALETVWGRIEYRTAGMKIAVRRSAPSEAEAYQFHVALASEEFWPIRGNLLSVTMPLTEAVG